MIGELTFAAVFLAGVISFLSPCVLPLVPAYLTYMTGASLEELSDDARSAKLSRFLLIQSVAFVVGISLVFVLLGATATQISLLLRQYSAILSIVAGIAIIIMGLHFLGVFRWSLLYRQAKIEGPKSTSGPGGALAMGLAFGFAWTPCIGPILGAVLAVAASRETVGQGASLLLVYALGMGLPFILAALAVGPFTRFLGKFREHMQTMERATGALLVATGTAFLLGWHTILANWMLDRFPGLVALT
ncbi:MAG: sulfite exporter TauE/SafE family protein [Rhizobiales bacterium]|nr:sulfite exporter TauE/SafE family protein [Hyphomicrobiales bacterium]MBO6697788.1 sulfite exporter TauE/SafE family protein [Hyphomicrobiales bacterium]MBO6735957.1 sulfite exporter TauE/SafE family protein [Hyphomicrobiales bacterium]MBO6912427.1 sulfite exporter TauE/SafE family protein [Hyphomicrobiales bacterium]MBO6955057.1 sulfite exporter TauE/SafE family protein [Hyphomicrobiales bacterium]